MQKKRNRRSESQFPAIDPKLNLKTRQNLIDYDYTDQLSDKDKQWLNDFTNEYVNADFLTNVKEGRKRIHRKKKSEHEKNKYLKKLINDFMNHMREFVTIINESQITNKSKSKLKKSVNGFKKKLRAQIIKEFKFIKDTYKTEAEHANNHRNMCILTTQSAMGILKSTDVLSERIMSRVDTEDEIINRIDNKKLGIEED